MKKYSLLLLLIAFICFLLSASVYAKASGKTIVCIGDSITYGHAVLEDRDHLAWPSILNALLGEGWEVENYGVSGATLQNEGDLPYVDTDYYSASLEKRADVYIIMLGTNDSKKDNWDEERFRTELKDFALEYQSMEHSPVVFLMCPPKCFPDPQNGIVQFKVQDEIIDQEEEIILDIADEIGVIGIDLYLLSQDHPEWFDDGVHPNVTGNVIIAECVYGVLEKYNMIY